MNRRLVIATMCMLFVLLVSACGGNDDPGGYPEGVRQNFITGCTNEDASEEDCICVLDYIEERVSLPDFVEMDRAANESGTIDDDLMRILEAAVISCL